MSRYAGSTSATEVAIKGMHRIHKLHLHPVFVCVNYNDAITFSSVFSFRKGGFKMQKRKISMRSPKSCLTFQKNKSDNPQRGAWRSQIRSHTIARHVFVIISEIHERHAWSCAEGYRSSVRLPGIFFGRWFWEVFLYSLMSICAIEINKVSHPLKKQCNT